MGVKFEEKWHSGTSWNKGLRISTGPRLRYHPTPAIQLDSQDRGWLASAIDCESAAGIYSNGKSGRAGPRMAIQMMNRDFVKRIREITGLGYFGPISFKT